MNAIILAAGLGTRLRPWTLEHPKALVPVGGIPMLERVVVKLRAEGFDRIVVNVHHFSGQVKEFLANRDFGVEVKVSDESELLLDTGGAIAKAAPLFGKDCGPILVHNVDIVSDADLSELSEAPKGCGADVTLLTSGRDSSRRLLFDGEQCLRGWHNLTAGEYRPETAAALTGMSEHAFSGIYMVSEEGVADIRRYSQEIGREAFPVMDWLLAGRAGLIIKEHYVPGLDLIDIGKPETLAKARLKLG